MQQDDNTTDPGQTSETAQSGGNGGGAQGWDALQEELRKLRDLAARAQADLQNAKARAEREAADIRTFATESIVRRLLPTLDNFQRAFLHVPEELQEHEWVKGVAAIEQDLMRTMTDAGLKRMDAMGAVVDPQFHEVLTMGPGPEGTVTEVFEEGYMLHGKVLRPAKVRAGEGAATRNDQIPNPNDQ